jgi:hypothetical protein
MSVVAPTNTSPQGSSHTKLDIRHLDGWLERRATERDGAAWLVGKAIVILVRGQSQQGAKIKLSRICGITHQQSNVVAAIIYRLRDRGCLSFTRSGPHGATQFTFIIPTLAQEITWAQQREGQMK